MAGLSAVGGVGAGLSQARFQAEYQVRVLKEQQAVVDDLGSAALKLIKMALSSEPMQHDLDVIA
ncbi:MAG TPA: hypothetical protein HPP77_10720 [Candidatus Hydrogenedentes bacterium]|nr:hypothetical protein [Candidatus Hydrogenedentota bacterium]HIJ72908.1 hypothetical protein [Candidatus Hydrogenedentota bacterium]